MAGALLHRGALCPALLFWAATVGAQETVLEAVTVIANPDKTQVVLDLSQDTSYRFFRLSEPQRAVVDIDGGSLGLQALPETLPAGQLLGIRHGVRAGGVLRIVFDLDESRFKTRDFVLFPDREQSLGHRIVIEFLPETPGALIAGVETAGDADASASAPDASPHLVEPDPGDVITEDLPAARASPPGLVTGAGAEQGLTSPSDSRDKRRSPGGTTVDFSGTWQHEWAWATEPSESQKFESFVQPRWDVSFANGVDVTAILRVRVDGVGDLGPAERRPPNYSDVTAPWFNGSQAELSLRELFVDFQWGSTDWRLGKQQVVWGQADGIKVLDVVNPQSFREFILDDFEDSRIPLWTANITVPVGDAASLQLLWIPDTTYHELAEQGTPFAFTSPRIIPPVPITAIAEFHKPDDVFADSDAGFALSGFVGGWDLSLNYLYRYLDTPVLPVRMRGPVQLQLEPEYRRSHLIGGSFSNAFGSVTLRGELAYNSDSFQPTDTLQGDAIAGSADLGSVIGLDWAVSMNTLMSVQWFSSYLMDYSDAMARDEFEQTVSYLYQQDLANATWRVRGIAIHSLNDRDTQLQLRLSHWLTSELELWLGGDAFAGNRRGLFGQFGDNDRVVFGFEYGF